MITNLIDAAYEKGPRYEILLKDIQSTELLSDLRAWIQSQVDGRPDWEMINFAAIQTWHLDQSTVEEMIIEIQSENEGSAKIWGIVGWYLRGYWKLRKTVNGTLVHGLIGSLSLASISEYIPDGPIAALGTVITIINDQTLRNNIKQAVTMATSKVALCNAAKAYAKNIVAKA